LLPTWRTVAVWSALPPPRHAPSRLATLTFLATCALLTYGSPLSVSVAARTNASVSIQRTKERGGSDDIRSLGRAGRSRPSPGAFQPGRRTQLHGECQLRHGLPAKDGERSARVSELHCFALTREQRATSSCPVEHLSTACSPLPPTPPTTPPPATPAPAGIRIARSIGVSVSVGGSIGGITVTSRPVTIAEPKCRCWLSKKGQSGAVPERLVHALGMSPLHSRRFHKDATLDTW
jgi:hypothetical protein